jgi:hypothetical protein
MTGSVRTWLLNRVVIAYLLAIILMIVGGLLVPGFLAFKGRAVRDATGGGGMAKVSVGCLPVSTFPAPQRGNGGPRGW